MKITDLALVPGLLLVEEHPVVIPEEVNGIMLNPERIAQIKASRRVRTGEVRAEGVELSSLINGNSQSATSSTQSTLSLVGQIIVYDAPNADLFDLPLEDAEGKRLVFLNKGYLLGIVETSNEPNTID